MTANLLSVIEQQNKALKHILAGALSLPRFAEAEANAANAAIAAGEQALEQTQGEWKHCSPELLASGVSCKDAPRRPCECEHGGSHDHWITHPQATEPAPSTAGERERIELERWGRSENLCLRLLDRMDDGYWTPWHIATEAIAALQKEIDSLSSELTKAQDELNCTEQTLEAASCELSGPEFENGFDCMGDFAMAVWQGFKKKLDAALLSAPALPAAAMPVGELTESELMKCIAQAGCFGTVELSYESGPYDIDRPTLNATKLARAILAAAHGITKK